MDSTTKTNEMPRLRNLNKRQLRRIMSRSTAWNGRAYSPRGVPEAIVNAVAERQTEKGRQSAVQSFFEKGKVPKLRAKTDKASDSAEVS